MTTICQNVGILTTLVLRTSSTIYVTTSTQQMAGRPITSTIVDATATCRTAGSGNSTTVACATSAVTRVSVITPPGTQIQVPVTVTNQVILTQANTLFGSLCRTLPSGAQPTPDGFTDMSYTTEYFTVTGADPSTPTTSAPTSTRTDSRSTLSRNTVYGAGDPTSEPGPSDTALGAGSDHSGSSSAPVGAIVGGVIGGLVALGLIGFLVYYLVKKSFASKGYNAPGEESPYHDGEQSDVFGSEQTGYYAQGYDGQGYSTGPQNQGFGGQSGPTQPQGSYPMQYADMGQGTSQLQPQNAAGGNMYPEPQGPQYMSQTEMGQTPFNTSSGTAFPVAAAVGVGAASALPVVAAASISQRYSSSSSPPPGSTIGQYSPESHLSTIPLIHPGSPHQRQHPVSHTNVPYRGYAEPADG